MNRYLWIIAVQWARPDGTTAAATLFDVGTSTGPISRLDVLKHARGQLMREHDVPDYAAVTHFSVEPELLTFIGSR